MITFLARRKPWQILALGVISILAGYAVVHGLAQLGYDNLPVAAWSPLIVSHLLGCILVTWLIPRPFIEAYTIRLEEAVAAFHAPKEGK